MAKRILLVEDEQTVSRALQVLLAKGGHDVTPVRTAEDAITQMTRARPDLLVVDAHLPGMSGYALCQSIAQRNDIPMLLMTTRTGETERSKAIALGATAVIAKPFTAAQFELVFAKLNKGESDEN